jgi:hypothetical protein
MAFLDTHKAIERIIQAGASKEMAEAIVDSVNTKNDDVATKSDIHELRTELKTDISELKTEVSAINTNLKWLMAIVLALVGILLKNTFI